MGPSVGDKAPGFTIFNSADSAPVSLSDYAGKNVVLAFYPAAYSGVCDTEMCTFRDSLAEFNSLGADVLGISVDPPKANAHFAEENGLNFPILSDIHHEAIKAYGIEFDGFAGIEGYTVALRSVFVIDKSGNVAWSWITDSQGNQPPYDEVQAAVKALG